MWQFSFELPDVGSAAATSACPSPTLLEPVPEFTFLCHGLVVSLIRQSFEPRAGENNDAGIEGAMASAVQAPA